MVHSCRSMSVLGVAVLLLAAVWLPTPPTTEAYSVGQWAVAGSSNPHAALPLVRRASKSDSKDTSSDDSSSSKSTEKSSDSDSSGDTSSGNETSSSSKSKKSDTSTDDASDDTSSSSKSNKADTSDEDTSKDTSSSSDSKKVDTSEDDTSKDTSKDSESEDDSKDSKSSSKSNTATRSVKLTFYWSEKQESIDAGNVVLGTCAGKKLASVTKDFADKAKMEGTAILANGKTINLGSCDCNNYMCFEVTDGAIGSGDNTLVPYYSVAANDMSRGTTLQVAKLKGVKLPNGKTHNGCVRVDDEGWSFGDNQIDWYVETEANYKSLNAVVTEGAVDIVPTTCTIGS
ncbi:hypothetical protein H4R33_006579 [Dimargaris cristalligena]|uniref:3D domain-containing protein n=1 Tax=Dimargaris cristalligena TaxID=215637 RepID=A0A4V1J546_9FUNG|nr:hypothetical protein H4R33_006579 [Dimargaris cristalligena]RKP37789.1 hypothetical protein BJ085DRAFT_30816 [Dimargaris cristalligena]|eukprot:RKP37789.1 hypothetical protein BJ085DRAFT_30816 [Dimargaris cristalligena]